jgi:inosose dehydratase
MSANTASPGSVRLAGAPDSWGVWFAEDPRQPPPNRFLDEVVQAGYKATELGPWGYLPTDPDRLKSELQSRGLELCGVTSIAPLEDESNWPQLEAEVRAVAKLATSFGVQHYVLIDNPYGDLMTGELLDDRELDPKRWKSLVNTVTSIGEWVKRDWNLQLVFHSHADTHVETEAQLERLLDDTPADAVSLCLDTGHHNYCGGDAVAFARKHADRIRHLHLKDVDPGLRRQVAEQNIPFAVAVGQGVFVEPGKGTIDFAKLRDVLRDVGYGGWAVVEQDMYPVALDKPLPIAQRTRKHLVEAGFDA